MPDGCCEFTGQGRYACTLSALPDLVNMVLMNTASGNHQAAGVASRRFPLNAGQSKRTFAGERSRLTKTGGAQRIAVLAAAMFVSQVRPSSATSNDTNPAFDNMMLGPGVSAAGGCTSDNDQGEYGAAVWITRDSQGGC